MCFFQAVAWIMYKYEITMSLIHFIGNLVADCIMTLMRILRLQYYAKKAWTKFSLRIYKKDAKACSRILQNVTRINLPIHLACWQVHIQAFLHLCDNHITFHRKITGKSFVKWGKCVCKTFVKALQIFCYNFCIFTFVAICLVSFNKNQVELNCFI